MSGATQINVTYDPGEDRLLLRMGTPGPQGPVEYRMWLTRRFLQLMWQGLDQSMEAESATDPTMQPEVREAVKQFKEEAAISQADFSTPYKKAPAVTPLGPAPLLITKMQIKKGEGDKKVLIMSGENGQGVTLALAESMLYSVRKLLADGAKKAGWGLSLSVMAPKQASMEQEPRTLN